mmetsp:Transcript_44451/g.119833  ORF Transcript_44451/g.119833 Transcript_44451/m.119833 type:complete len:158 (-) Transcript_44451:38-511(-)
MLPPSPGLPRSLLQLLLVAPLLLRASCRGSGGHACTPNGGVCSKGDVLLQVNKNTSTMVLSAMDSVLHRVANATAEEAQPIWAKVLSLLHIKEPPDADMWMPIAGSIGCFVLALMLVLCCLVNRKQDHEVPGFAATLVPVGTHDDRFQERQRSACVC